MKNFFIRLKTLLQLKRSEWVMSLVMIAFSLLLVFISPPVYLGAFCTFSSAISNFS